MATIGFLGLGNMGAPMAANLVTAGFDLNVHDVDRNKAASLVEAGAHWSDSIQAAVLNVKLGHVDAWIDKRRALAARYLDELAAMPIELPHETEGQRCVYYLFSIMTDDRDDLQAYLQAAGVDARAHYGLLITEQPPARAMGFDHRANPVAARQRLRHVAAYHKLTSTMVAGTGEAVKISRQSIAPDQRRISGKGVIDADGSRQRIIIDLQRHRAIFGGGFGLTKHQRHRLPDKNHPPACQQQL